MILPDSISSAKNAVEKEVEESRGQQWPAV